MVDFNLIQDLGTEDLAAEEMLREALGEANCLLEALGPRGRGAGTRHIFVGASARRQKLPR